MRWQVMKAAERETLFQSAGELRNEFLGDLKGSGRGSLLALGHLTQHSRGTFHFHSFQGSFFLENVQNSRQNCWFSKRAMVVKNGESSPRSMPHKQTEFVAPEGAHTLASFGTCPFLQSVSFFRLLFVGFVFSHGAFM